MRYRYGLIAASALLFFGPAVRGQTFDLDFVGGKWVSVTPGRDLGEPVEFTKAFEGYDVVVPFFPGFSYVGRSDGEGGSHIMVRSRDGETCFYYVEILDFKEMTWARRGENSPNCPRSALFRRVVNPVEDSAEDTLLKNDSKDLPPWQRWEYWKNRGIWQYPDAYCDSLTALLKTKATSFVYDESGELVDLDNFTSGKIRGNFFIRSDPAFSDDYKCGVSERDADYVVYCRRDVTKSARVYDRVFERTLNDVRTCAKQKGWKEWDISNDGGCSAAYIRGTGRRSCNRGFNNGPQDIWLYSKFRNSLFSIGIQVTLENKDGRPVQGEYEIVDEGRLEVRSERNGIVTFQAYDRGTLVSVRWKENERTTRFIQFDADMRILELEDEFGHFGVQYEAHFKKPAVISMRNVGSLLVSYDSEGNITKVTSAPASAKVTIAKAWENSLDSIPKWARR
jgi:hypothetical protein